MDEPSLSCAAGLPVLVAVRILQQRYPAGLVCIRCATLLATSSASHRLSDRARRRYVCAECRQEASQAERLAEVRRANLTRARQHRQDALATPARVDTLPTMNGMRATPRGPAVYAGKQGGFSLQSSRRWAEWGRKGGRPRKYPDERAARQGARDRVRVHRERAKTPPGRAAGGQGPGGHRPGGGDGSGCSRRTLDRDTNGELVCRRDD